MSHGHHPHGHHHAPHGHSARARLAIAVVLTLGFAVIEALAGWWSGSLALLGDAGHMVTDSTALAIAAVAAWMATRPPSERHSYGLGRMEVIAALLNGLFMLAVVAGIAAAAVGRLQTPVPVNAPTVMLVAGIGLLINITIALTLSHGAHDLNTRGALLHVMGDLLGSVAALASGVVIHFSGWTLIDPILSLFICAVILFSTLSLLRESLHVLMEGVPLNLDLPEVGKTMARTEGVISVHDLHIWNLSSGEIALSAHVLVRSMVEWQTTLERLCHRLDESFGISHVTLQPESADVPIQWERASRAPARP